MSLKLEKIAAEREKARRKRDEWEERRKEWDRKYHEQENSEICEMVHAQSLTPEQLAVIIQMAQAAVFNPENLKLDEKETEDTDKIYAEQLANEYAPKDTSKVVALRKLDTKAKLPATVFTYTFGIITAMVAGVWMCLSMKVIGNSTVTFPLSIG